MIEDDEGVVVDVAKMSMELFDAMNKDYELSKWVVENIEQRLMELYGVGRLCTNHMKLLAAMNPKWMAEQREARKSPLQCDCGNTSDFWRGPQGIECGHCGVVLV